MISRRYWFKPKRFWGCFAAYYPVAKEGWIVAFGAIATILFIFLDADMGSHSVSDTFFGMVPGTLVVLLVFDIISFRTGQYPSWWKKRHESDTD